MPRFLLIDTTGETVENGARRQVEADSAVAAVQAVADGLPVRAYAFTVVSLDAASTVSVTPSVSLTVDEVLPVVADDPPVVTEPDPAPADPAEDPAPTDPPADPVV